MGTEHQYGAAMQVFRVDAWRLRNFDGGSIAGIVEGMGARSEGALVPRGLLCASVTIHWTWC